MVPSARSLVNGGIVTWGHQNSGGDSSGVQAKLQASAVCPAAAANSKMAKQAAEPTRRSARLRGEAAAVVPAPGGQKRKAASSAQRKPGKAAKTE